MRVARWGPRFGLASAMLVAGGCIVVLATHAASDRRLLAAHPGETAPDFVLPRIPGEPGEQFHLAEQRGSIVVLYFCSTICPVSNDYEQRVIELHRQYSTDGRVRFVAVHVGSPPALPVDVAARSSSAGQRFASVIDADGRVAAEYAVQQTPTFLVIDAAGEIAYRGAFDDNRRPEQAKRQYVANAVWRLLKGHEVKVPITEVAGCPVR